MTEKQPRRKRTLEAITASAAQYASRLAWKRADRSAYEAARERGLLNVVCKHMPEVRRPLALDHIKASAAKHTKRSAWKRADRGAYLAAAKRGLLDTVCAHMDPVPSSQTLSLAEIRASAALYPTRQAWERGNPSAYNAAKQRRLFDAVCGHMPASSGKLPLDALMASAARYQSRATGRTLIRAPISVHIGAVYSTSSALT